MKTRCAVLTALVLSAPAAAQFTHGRQPERPDMPLAPPVRHPVSPAYRSVIDTNYLTQVNVNAQNMNIVGDAANEPSIAIDPTAPNRLVIAWRQFDTISSNFRQAGYAWSNDGGRSWHFPGVLTPGNFRSDPIVETDSVGNFYYYSLPDQTLGWHCDLFKSTNGGQTWGPPILANGGDRAWMSIDKTGGIGNGNIYGDWNANFSCCGTGNFGRDTSDGALPWPAAVTAPANPLLSTTAVGPNGEVYFAGAATVGNVRIMRSDNARDPAQTPSFALSNTVGMGAGVLPNTPGNPGGASGQVWVDVNRSTGARRGHVYVMTSAGAFGTDPSDIRFARSTDNGATWSTAVRVNDDAQAANHYQWFPTMSVAPGGRIDATWYDTRDSLNAAVSRLYYSYSTDEGATWSPSVALSNSFNTTVGWPQQNKIGDYFDQESDDVGLFIAFSATFNNEQDVYFMRVNDWDCNRNGIPDSTDLANNVLHDCNANGIPDECEIAAGIPVPCFNVCYADCDQNHTLNVNDFVCYQNRFAAQDPYADCNHDNALNVNDFICFQGAFAAGCP